MCIKRSVGLSGRNDLMGVSIVQILLNLNLPRFTEAKPAALKTDGRIGPGTLKLLTRFETEVMKLPSSDQLSVSGLGAARGVWPCRRRNARLKAAWLS